MEDQKRFILAIVLMSAFLFFWVQFLGPKQPPKPAAPATTSTPIVTAATAVPATTRRPEPGRGATRPLAKTVARETAVMNMTWTSTPGTIEKALLRKFLTSTRPAAPPVPVIPFMGEATPPLVWRFDVDGQTYDDQGQGYEIVAEGPQQIVFERDLGPKLRIRKTFAWKEDAYTLDEVVEVINRGTAERKVKAETSLATGTSGAKAPSMFNPGDPLHATAFINEKAIRLTPGDLLKGKPFPPGDIQWAGFDSRYFLLSLAPVEGRWLELHSETILKGTSADPKVEENVREFRLLFTYPPRQLRPEGSERWGLRMYAGPKDIGILRSAGSGMDHAIDLGDWLGPIARPILDFLRFLYRIIPNYGVAIILLTVLVRLILFPFAHMQAKSFKKMQEHKPYMDALKTKYGENKEAYSRELMSYMRTNRINPMGGCLLLLPQLPIFFALYRVLYNSIELRQAPFALWIRDLSAHDPSFVLPIVLGVVMFIQQRMTPTPGADPAQQTMMKIMPVMFTFFMLFLPSGLTLYILLSTLWGIGQQAWVQRGMAPKITGR
ncbi:MAG: membrane protein insertase YidC [Pseudomonadota bacterium]